MLSAHRPVINIDSKAGPPNFRMDDDTTRGSNDGTSAASAFIVNSNALAQVPSTMGLDPVARRISRSRGFPPKVVRMRAATEYARRDSEGKSRRLDEGSERERVLSP